MSQNHVISGWIDYCAVTVALLSMARVNRLKMYSKWPDYVVMWKYCLNVKYRMKTDIRPTVFCVRWILLEPFVFRHVSETGAKWHQNLVSAGLGSQTTTRWHYTPQKQNSTLPLEHLINQGGSIFSYASSILLSRAQNKSHNRHITIVHDWVLCERLQYVSKSSKSCFCFCLF